jgi:dimethylargininase
MMFRNAIVRIPGENFADGITTGVYGIPDYKIALQQHRAYQEALVSCGLEVVVLPSDTEHPDSTFVEDAAIITERCAILTNPGADSRKGEVRSIQGALIPYFDSFSSIEDPGTLDGGDICDADGHFFIGISERTNKDGAQQLADILSGSGYTAVFVPVTGIPGILHLKSGISYLGDGNLVLAQPFLEMEVFRGYNVIQVDPDETYAANCVRVNDAVLMAAGYRKLQKAVESLGYRVITLEMSEYQKMDGGLSCLSLRF